MAVRLTESRIPVGFKPEDLGQVYRYPENLNNDPDYCLISYLTSPVTTQSRIDYVVFVLNKTEVSKYKWIVFIDGKKITEKETENGVFDYTPEIKGSMEVDVSFIGKDGYEITLYLLQEVIDPNTTAENEYMGDYLQYIKEEWAGKYIKETARTALQVLAIMGHPPTTRELVNDFKEYIYDAFSGQNDIPIRLLAAVAYREMLFRPKIPGIYRFDSVRSNEIESVANALNGDMGSKIFNSVGVCQIKPQTLAMVLPNPINNNQPYTQWREKPTKDQDESQQKKVDDEIQDDYVKLDINIKIDLFNLLRFPKSNIAMCLRILTSLKNRTNRWPKENCMTLGQHALEIIATEYNLGATTSSSAEAKSTGYGKSVYKIMNAPFILHNFKEERFTIKGQIVDSESYNVVKEVRIDVYKSYLKIINPNGVTCYMDISSMGDPSSPSTLPSGQYPVLEIINYGTENTSSEKIYAKIKISSNSEGSVCYKNGGTFSEEVYLIDKCEKKGITQSDDKGNFTFNVNERQCYKIRTVKKDYFDSEIRVLAPSADNKITMEAATNNICESEIIKKLKYFEGFSYSLTDPNYPYPINVNGLKTGAKQNNCCTFVEALLVKVWLENVNQFVWGSTRHDQMVIASTTDYYSPITVAIAANMAVEIDKDQVPPPWTLVQGWQGTPGSAGVGGHTFIIVDVHPETKRVLTLESNKAYSIDGPGFRMIGDIDKFKRVVPSRSCKYLDEKYNILSSDINSNFVCPYLTDLDLTTEMTPNEMTPNFSIDNCLKLPPEDENGCWRFFPEYLDTNWWDNDKLWKWDQFKTTYPYRKMARLRIFDLEWAK